MIPQFEHDACGVGFVCQMKGRRSHEIVQQALTILVNLDHRGACGCEANTGDGAGILMQMPARVSAEESRPPPGSSCPGRATTASAWSSRRRTRRPAKRAREDLRADRRRGRPEGPRLARHPDGQLMPRQDREGQRAVHAPGFHRARRELRRRPGLRAQALRHPQARRLTRSAPRASDDFWYCSEPFVPDGHLQGHAHARAGRAVLSRPARPGHGHRAGAGPFALLDEHLPELGALASVPLHRAQRRDQHAARQHQLDARARRRMLETELFGDDIKKILPIVNTERQRTRRCSTTASNCSSWAGARCRTR